MSASKPTASGCRSVASASTPRDRVPSDVNDQNETTPSSPGPMTASSS
jgi:hypothetical protein